jgi:hypothetical protein
MSRFLQGFSDGVMLEGRDSSDAAASNVSFSIHNNLFDQLLQTCLLLYQRQSATAVRKVLDKCS